MRLTTFLLYLLFTAPAFAGSPSIVGTPVISGSLSSGNNTTTGTGSYTIATSGDDLLIVLGARLTGPFSLSSITTSSGSLTTDLAFSAPASDYVGTGIYRIHSATAQTYTITVTFNKAITAWTLHLIEVSNLNAVDGTVPAQGIGSGTAVSTGSITTSDNGDLVIAASDDNGAIATTWTSPFVSVSSSGTGIGIDLNVADYTQTSAAAISAAATLGASKQWAAPIVAYSGGTAPTIHPNQMFFGGP
jgi:hypothetical protein